MVEPYYRDDNVTLYLGDCREIIPSLPVSDLLCTDPPYGMSWQSGLRDVPFEKIAGDDGLFDVAGAIALALRALRPFRHVYLFGRYDLSALPLTSAVELIWDKGNIGPGDLTIPWGPQHEPIMFSMYVPSKANRDRGSGRLAARLRQGSVLRVPRLNSRGVSAHPTEKPVTLMRMLIESSSTFGETVFDPFAGSGSTLVAAVMEGRKAVGIEIDEKYAEHAAKRCEAESGK